jgi:transposase InsO family protein
MSRQNYYKQRKARLRREIDEDLVVALVKGERQVQPRLGGRKLLWILSGEFAEADLHLGRDRLFEILRKYGMLLKPLRKGPRTTDSRHTLPVFRNEIKGVEPTGPGQILVSDITYIRTSEGFEYLKLIMDLHSRKVVGYQCDDDLSAVGCLKALEQALAELPAWAKAIHHSDRGSQYCSHDYVGRLISQGVTVSMTEENHCAENSHAERLNETLKYEYGLLREFRTRSQARAAVDQAVWLYNNRRPHLSLRMRTPSEVHANAA